MFLRIAEAQSAEQSGIKGVKRPFDPNIMSFSFCCLRSRKEAAASAALPPQT